MNLRYYPRPRNDTGIGVHWSAGVSDVSTDALRSFWIPELQALGVKWVKIPAQHHAATLAEELLAATIMPIVQIRRRRPLPARLAVDDVQSIETFVRSGVRYFELEARPDHPQQWERGVLPANALTQFVRTLAADLETVLALGGAPGLPVLAPETDWHLTAALSAHRRDDLLRGAVWQAVHNLALNRPLDYPHDAGSRQGAPLTSDFYESLAQEPWDGDAWQGRERGEINDLRRALAADDAGAGTVPLPDVYWRSYERQHRQHQEALGRPLPILSTIGGWLIGSNEDARHPTVTPLLQAAQTVEACRVMMGTSRRHRPAPDYYFCTAFWLLANALLRSAHDVPEEDAWYSAGQVLPLVQALRMEPTRARARAVLSVGGPADAEQPPDPLRAIAVSAPRQTPAASCVQGRVRGGSGVEVRLVDTDGMLYATLADETGAYRFVDLPRGEYTAWVHRPLGSRRNGIVLDGSNQATVRLSRDGWGTEIEHLHEEADDQTTATAKTIFRCRVEASAATSEAGTLSIRLRRRDEDEGRVINMARRADGTTGCEVGSLASGRYRVEVLGIVDAGGEPMSLVTDVIVQPQVVTQLTFVFSAAASIDWQRSSQIAGRISGGRPAERGDGDGNAAEDQRPVERDAESGVDLDSAEDEDAFHLVLCDQDGKKRTTAADAEGAYRFEALPAGVYHLSVVGYEGQACRNRIALDGQMRVSIDFSLSDIASAETLAETEDADEHRAAVRSQPDWGAVRIEFPPGTEGPITLVGRNGRRYRQVMEQDAVHFPRVRPDTYTASGLSYYQPGLDVYPGWTLEVELPLLGPYGTPASPPRWHHRPRHSP